MLEVLAAVACLGFSVLLLLGGLTDRVFDVVFRRSTQAQWDLYQRMGARSSSTLEGHVRVSRVLLVVGGVIGTVACLAWLLSITVRTVW